MLSLAFDVFYYFETFFPRAKRQFWIISYCYVITDEKCLIHIVRVRVHLSVFVDNIVEDCLLCFSYYSFCFIDGKD